MNDTPIEWTHKTWNPVRGCSPVSPGCKRCYAEKIAVRFSGDRGPGLDYAKATLGTGPFSGFAIITPTGGHWTGKVELVEKRLADPLNWKTPQRIFVNSMSDLFHENLSDEDILRVFQIMGHCPAHTFQILTKRAERMREWTTARRWRNLGHSPEMGGDNYVAIIPGEHRESDSLFLPNVWLGVSVEDRERKSRIDVLRDIPAAVRFVSIEPLIEDPGVLDLDRISWIIVGGESGAGARPFDLKWARDTVSQCQAAGTPVFVKQLGSRPKDGGERLKLKSRKGGDPDEWPESLRVRDFPKPAPAALAKIAKPAARP